MSHALLVSPIAAPVVANMATFVTNTLAGFSAHTDPTPLAHGVVCVTVDDVVVFGDATDAAGMAHIANSEHTSWYPDDADPGSWEQVELFICACATWSFPNLHPDAVFALQFTTVAADYGWPLIGVAITCYESRTGNWLPDIRPDAHGAPYSFPESYSSERGLGGFYANAQLDRLGGWIDAGVDLEDAARMHMAALGVQVAVHEAQEQTLDAAGSLVDDPHAPHAPVRNVTVVFESGIVVTGTNLAVPAS